MPWRRNAASSDLAGNRDLRRAEQAAFLLAHARPAAERFRLTGAAALNAPYSIMTDALIGALRAEGIPLSLWTLNDEDVLREYLDSVKEETVVERETSDQDLWEDLKKRAEAYGDH